MLNRCEFIGHLGRDPELTYVLTGDALVKFSLATTERWKDKSGAKQEKTEWIPCQAWGKLAEIIGEYGHKGQQVYIAGKYQTREYEDKVSSEKKRTTSIKVEEFRMLSRADQQAAPKPAPKPASEPASEPVKTRQTQTPPTPWQPDDELPPVPEDDDIPF